MICILQPSNESGGVCWMDNYDNFVLNCDFSGALRMFELVKGMIFFPIEDHQRITFFMLIKEDFVSFFVNKKDEN